MRRAGAMEGPVARTMAMVAAADQAMEAVTGIRDMAVAAGQSMEAVTGTQHMANPAPRHLEESASRPTRRSRPSMDCAQFKKCCAGERVWAFDHASETWKLRHVLECYRSLHEGEIVVLQVAGEFIESTKGHPFWVIEGRALPARPQPEHVPVAPQKSRVPGRWVDAGDLQIGDVLLLKEESFATISGWKTRPAKEKVFNFQVEELHCYAVGANQVLVHNNSAQLQDGTLAPPGSQVIP